MNKPAVRGADRLVEGLTEAGVTTVFSLSGNQIMPVYDALFATDIRLLHTRHEGGAVYMAEAYAQTTGQIGVALITAAPGFANALSAMYTAKESETALLVLTGDSPVGRDSRGAFQELDQCAAAAPMVKATFRPKTAGAMREDITRAIAIAQSGRPGPVHLALPDDVLRQTDDADAPAATVPLPHAAPALSEADLATVAAHLSNAERPIVLAGPAFCRPQAKAALATFVERLNVPLVTFESPRGLRAPRLGAFAEMLPRADAVVALGKPLNFMVGFGDTGALGADCRVLQIDAEQALLDRDRAAHPDRIVKQIHADPNGAVEAVSQHMASTPHSANAWCREVMEAVAYRPAAWQDAAASSTITSIGLGSAIAAQIADDPAATLIIDGGEIGQWCQALADAEYAVINGPSGAIGASIPYAIGASSARPDHPVITVMGDGTAGFYLAEFETAVREQTPFVAIIGNDSRWNAEHQIQLRDYGEARAYACELTPARYDQVVAVLGGHGEYVTAPDELAPAIARAIASAKPACVNVMIDSEPAPTITRT